MQSNGKPCVIVADGGVCLKSDAVKVGDVWYRRGSEPARPATPPTPTSTSSSEGKKTKTSKE